MVTRTRSNKSSPSAPPAPHRRPLWEGPDVDGITFSLLSKFLTCRERFRLLVVEGLKESEAFNHKIEYGNLWHQAEEAFAAGRSWRSAIGKYRNGLRAEFPESEDAISKWADLCLRQFSVYLQYWSRHPESKRRKYFLQEETFAVPYVLPSGRMVILRGKWDAAFHEGKASDYLQENKSKGDIDEEGITRTVAQNLQVMIYLIALRSVSISDCSCPEIITPTGKAPLRKRAEEAFLANCSLCLSCKLRSAGYDPRKLKGVLYNVIRRPLSDKYAIRQKKSETLRAFYERVEKDIRKDPTHYFKRWKARITPRDIQTFARECFDPILEQLWDWWEWISYDPFDPWRDRPGYLGPLGNRCSRDGNGIHFRYPFGVYHSLASGFRGEYFDFLTLGTRRKLAPVPTLFPELA